MEGSKFGAVRRPSGRGMALEIPTEEGYGFVDQSGFSIRVGGEIDRKLVAEVGRGFCKMAKVKVRWVPDSQDRDPAGCPEFANRGMKKEMRGGWLANTILVLLGSATFDFVESVLRT